MKCDIYATTSEPIILLITKQGTPLSQLENLSSNIKIEDFLLKKTLNISNKTPLINISAESILGAIESKGFYITENNSSIKNSSFGVGIGTGILAASLGLTPIISIVAGIVAAYLVSKSKENK